MPTRDRAPKTERLPGRYGPDDVASEPRQTGRRRGRTPADQEERGEPTGHRDRSPLDRIWEGR